MRHVPECLDGLAAALAELGQSDKAAVLMGAAAEFRETIQLAITPPDRPHYERVLKCVREKLRDQFEMNRAKGRAMTLEQAIEYALDHTKDAAD